MKGTKGICLSIILTILISFFSGVTLAAPEDDPIVIKIAYPDAPVTKVGDYAIPFPTYSAMIAFKNSLEVRTSGKVKVELYPGGALGDHRSNLEQILAGNVHVAGPSDGPIAAFYKDIQVFSIPYLFSNSLQFYDVVDGPAAQEIFDDMAAKSGLRVLSVFENGGFRNFSNSKRPIKTADDMKGLKMRTMDIPAHMEMVKALGASPTPVAWTELYSGLQTGVVDGQENSALTTILGSLQEVQEYYTLDGHILGLAFLIIGEDFYQNLPDDIKAAVDASAVEATIAARGVNRIAESIAKQALIDSGVEVYAPTPEELETFKVAQKPVIEFLKKNVNPTYVDNIVAAANNAGTTEVSNLETSETPETVQSTPVQSSNVQSNEKTNNSPNLMYILLGIIGIIIVLYVVKRKSSN